MYATRLEPPPFHAVPLNADIKEQKKKQQGLDEASVSDRSNYSLEQ